jgi:predicted O-linked N-acetylglucosamine transferase (SPINDLY family)
MPTGMSSAQTDQLFRQAVGLHQAGCLSEAETLYWQILNSNPNSPDVLNALAILAQSRSETPRAIELLMTAIAINPDHADYHFNLGVIFASDGKANEAADAFQAALRLNPRHVRAAVDLGYVEYGRGELSRAIAAWTTAVDNGCQDPQVCLALGSALRDQGELDQSITVFRKFASANPDCGEAWNHLGIVLLEVARHDESHKCFSRAAELNAGPQAESNLLYGMLFNPGFDLIQILAEREKWNQKYARVLRPFRTRPCHDLNPDRPLRVGYVSPHFRDRPIGRFMLPLCAHHNHLEFETHFYDDSIESDALTRQLEACANVFRKTHHLSDAELASMIAEDRIDILVDLNMHMEASRLLVFARRPAPNLVTYLAYPGTTGMGAMDYRLSDPFLDPPAFNERVYSERTCRLRQSYWCYPQPYEAPEVGPLPADQRGCVTFGYFDSFSRISPGVLDVWGEVMNEVSGSRLMMAAPKGSCREMVSSRLAEHGVEASRLTFVERVSGGEYFARYCQVDIALDSFPFAGNAATCDSLWMGVPVVTLAGQGAVGRAGVSVLNNAGLAEFVAESREKYVRIAAGIAGDLKRLREIRRGLREKTLASPLMDARRYTQDVEAAYRKMWANYIVDGS